MATIKAGTYKLSKTPNLINNSKARTTEYIPTDGTVSIKDTVIQNGTEIECDGKGIQITWGGTYSAGASANGRIEIVNATPNDYMWRISEASDGSSYQYKFGNLTAPTDEQFDKVLTITLLSDADVSQDLYDWWTANTTAQTAKLSVDLTTLSGWANLSAGNHTIKIKAKGTGYKDSELSAGVTVSKAASTVTLEAGTYKWNDSVSLIDIDQDIEFTSNNTQYTIIKSNEGRAVITYTTSYMAAVYNNGAWTDNSYKTITLSTDQQVSQEFYTWFIANANKVYTLEAGTYKWTGNPDIMTGYFNSVPGSDNISLSFQSNSVTYNSITLLYEKGTKYTHKRILYGSTMAYRDDVDNGTFNSRWLNDNYRTITLSTPQTVSAEFYNWAITQGNLVKQAGQKWTLNSEVDIASIVGAGDTVYLNNVSFTCGAAQVSLAKSIRMREIADGPDVAYDIYIGNEDTFTNSGTTEVIYSTAGGATGWFGSTNVWTFNVAPTGDLLTWLNANGTKSND